MNRFYYLASFICLMNLVVAPEAGRQSVLGTEMPASSLFSEMDRGIGDERALQLALELSMLGFSEPLSAVSEPESPGDLAPFVGSLATVGLDEVRSKKSQNMTECVPVPSSEHVAEIVGRQGRHQHLYIYRLFLCRLFPQHKLHTTSKNKAGFRNRPECPLIFGHWRQRDACKQRFSLSLHQNF